jgi:hypothetical protein
LLPAGDSQARKGRTLNQYHLSFSRPDLGRKALLQNCDGRLQFVTLEKALSARMQQHFAFFPMPRNGRSAADFARRQSGVRPKRPIKTILISALIAAGFAFARRFEARKTAQMASDTGLFD